MTKVLNKFPKPGKPDVNLLEQFFEPTPVPGVAKRTERNKPQKLSTVDQEGS